MSGRVAGRYQLLQQLGKGGMGEVWLARDLATGTECAVKLLAKGATPELAARLRAEFETLSAVRHPALVQVRELGFQPTGEPFLTMDFVPGLPADGALVRGDWPAFFRVAARVASALNALHSAQVVHGDVKPQNILVAPSGDPTSPPEDVRLVDLGLAAMPGVEHTAFAGTIGYAAPEITRGEVPTPASDLFGLGATFHTLITGGVARLSSVTGTADHERPIPSAQPLEQSGAPAALRELVLALLAPAPHERPASAAVVLEALARMHPAAHEPLTRRIDAQIFVGRAREQARFGSALLGARRRPRVLLIEGEPGSGRSALLSRMATLAAKRGSWVAEARQPRQAGPAGAALVLLRKLAAAAGVDSAEAALPLNARAAMAGYGEALDAEDMRELAEAAVGWLQILESSHPVLFADDFDEFDEASRALLMRIALHPRQPRMLWVWSAGHFGSEVPALSALGFTERMLLEPFGREDVAALVHARLGSPAPAGLLRFLLDHGAGRPGLAVEWLRAFAQAGILEAHESGVHAHTSRFHTVSVPDAYEDVQLARLEAAPPEARELVLALAAAGYSADRDLLARLAPELAITSVDALVRQQILAREADGIAFRSRTLGARWFARQPEADRRQWFERCATLEGLSPTRRFELAVELGNVEEGLALAETLWMHTPRHELADRAAALAERAGRNDEAVRWIDSSVALLFQATRFDEVRARLRHSLTLVPADGERLLLLARAELRTGHDAEAMAALAQALTPDCSPGLRARIVLMQGHRAWRQGDADARARLYQQGAELAKASGDDRALAMSGEFCGSLALTLGHYDEALTEFRSAIDAARRMHDLSSELITLSRIADVEHRQGHSAQALHLLSEGVARARLHDQGRALQNLLATQATVHAELADWRAAIECNEALARLDVESNDLLTLSEDVIMLATLESLSGLGRDAVRRARSAWRLSCAHARLFRGRAATALGSALRNCGRLRSAKRWGARGVALTLQQSNVDARQWARFEYARTCMALGQSEDALKVLELGRAETGGANGDLLVSILLGRARLRARQVSGAANCAREVEAVLERQPRPYVQAHLEVLRSELAMLRPDPETARIAARRALEGFERLPSTADRAAAALDFSQLALGTEARDSYPIESWLDIAIPVFERLGDAARRRRSLETLVEALRLSRSMGSPGSDSGLLGQVSHLLNSLSNLEELARRAMEMACERFGAERGVVLLIDPVTGELAPLLERGGMSEDDRERVLGYSRRVVRHVTDTGKSVVIRDATEDRRLSSQSLTDMRLRSVLAVPMFVGGRTVGAVYLDDSRRPDVFSHSDRGLLEGFAQLIAVAIEQSRGQQEIERANERLVDENRSFRSQSVVAPKDSPTLGLHPSMQKLESMIELAADQDVRVLLTGESGTGKEFVARELHRRSRRRNKPFVVANCGALAEQLIESELFGIKEHVATGVVGREGLFQLADGGTLLLDEIGEMPMKDQVKLLTVLQNKEVTPVGSGKPIPVDVRVIAATNRDLRLMMHEGTFREDLFFRLNVLPIHMPPLRERKADIPLLARQFAEEIAKAQNRPTPKMSRQFLAVLMRSDWPGNVRELQNYIARIIAMTPEGELEPIPLPRDLEEGSLQLPAGPPRSLAEAVEELERSMIRKALDEAGGNKSLAARNLGLKEQTLRYRLSRQRSETAR